MDEEQRKQIAVFRFGVIADFVTGSDLEPGEKERLLREKSARRWDIPFSGRTHIGRTTIRDWIRRYRRGGCQLEALYPKNRSDKGRCRRIDEETAANLVHLRREMPTASVARIIHTMEERKLISLGESLSVTSVWRFLTAQGLMSKKATPVDRRKFEAELPNDIWQSDVLHGPAVKLEARQRRSYLIAFIDDHSRLIPHAAFYLSENLASFLDAFETALLKRGLPRKLYVDNGSAYRSHHLEHVCASLAIALIHARPYKPQGKGKIERFFRTVRTQFLATVTDGVTLEELNGSFQTWLDGYHQQPHSGIGCSPWQRFVDHLQGLRTAPQDLTDHFRVVARRRVAKDRTVTLDGRLFEAPTPLIGRRIDLLYHKNSMDRVEARWNNQSYGFLRPVDTAVNCQVKRDRNHNTQVEPTSNTPARGGSVW